MRLLGKALMAMGLIMAFLAFFTLWPTGVPPPSPAAPPARELRAAIIDTLCITNPNQTFIDEVTSHLRRGGFEVDIYAGSDVTVELFRRLPSLNYGVLVLRTHSLVASVERVVIITGEHWKPNKYVVEQLRDSLVATVPVFMPREITPENTYFGVTPKFVRILNGDFSDTIVILSGCQGTKYTSLADAFIKRGCRAYVGWTGLVTAEHTDKAIARLVYHLSVEGMGVSRGVEKTMSEVGPDPCYEKSRLEYVER